jgi:leader peptidase (prepilin peptidase) / N-methyltransferase
VATLLIVFMVALCWGSFLNVLAYRLVHSKSLFATRSQCPFCHQTIAWYDNIPLLSWLVLRGRCRQCKHSISWLYPFTELITAVLITALFYKFMVVPFGWWCSELWMFKSLWARCHRSFFAYAVMISALIAATRTDLEMMLIPQVFSLWLVPVGFLAAYLGLICLSLPFSVLGAVLGYGILWIIAFVFKHATGKDGMGMGDMELLAMIGSFLGPWGVWISLMIGSFAGLLAGALYLVVSGRKRDTRIPFGPFLALGAVIYFFFGKSAVCFLVGW